MIDENKKVELFSPCEDIVFKILLTRPNCEPILKSIISAFTGNDVKEVSIANTDLPGVSTNEKHRRLDVTCRTATETFDVEMQSQAMKGDNNDNSHINLRYRTVEYASSLFTTQQGEGVPYRRYKKTYVIMFCDFSLNFTKNTVARFHIKEDDSDFDYCEAFNIILVDLKKAAVLVNKPTEELTDKEKWIMFFEYADKKEYANLLHKISGTKGEINMAMEELGYISNDYDTQMRILKERQFQRDLEHDKAIMLEEGIQQGLQQGLQQGMQQGMQQEKLQVARKMVQRHLPISDIIDMTGLPQDVIAAL